MLATCCFPMERWERIVAHTHPYTFDQIPADSINAFQLHHKLADISVTAAIDNQL